MTLKYECVMRGQCMHYNVEMIPKTGVKSSKHSLWLKLTLFHNALQHKHKGQIKCVWLSVVQQPRSQYALKSDIEIIH